MYTKPLEADTRILVDKSLENLGYCLTNPKQKNVFVEQPRTEKERKKLHGKRPDYTIYSSNPDIDKPIIIIETKKRGENINSALQQGIEYAKILEAPIVFATDGVFCKSLHTKFKKTLLLNGQEVDEFIREVLALKFLNEYEINTISPEVKYSRNELIKIFNEANNMLRGEGLRAGIDRFGEFANILFLKLISESEDIKKENGELSKLSPDCHWDYIKNLPSSTRIEHINKIVLGKLNGLYETEIFTPLQIRDADTLKKIIDKLDPLKLNDVDSDIKGDAFEYFLKESTASGNDLGEYFTPRHIVKTMVRLANPQIGEKIYDPFCGTGGLLIESFRHVWNSMPRTPTTVKQLRNETIYGNEITNTARITKMNMILAGDGHSNINMRDSLANPIDGLYDIVLTNMPYSQKTKFSSLYEIPSNNGDSICVQHCMRAINGLSENGRMALVVPEGFLFRKDLAKTRELLLDRCNLRSVISLPQGVFLPYTGVKTNIIYCDKVNNKDRKKVASKHYWYFEVKNDGYTLDNHRRKIEGENDLERYSEYRKLDEEQKNDMSKIGFEAVLFEKVLENDLILIGARYRKINYSSAKYDIVSLTTILSTLEAGSRPKGGITGEGYGAISLGGEQIGSDRYLNLSKIPYVSMDFYNKASRGKVLDKDILVCKDGALTGKVCMVDAKVLPQKEVMVNEHCYILRGQPDRINQSYLFYIFSSELVQEQIKNLAYNKSAQPGLNLNCMDKIQIPLPPLTEQKKLVAGLDKIRDSIKSAETLIENLKTSGKDVIELFLNDLGNSGGGGVTCLKIKDIVTFASRGKAPIYGTSQVKVIKSGQLKGLYDFDLSKEYFLDSLCKIDERLLQKNDVLINSTGVGTAGRVGIFTLDGDFVVDSHITILRFNDKVEPAYIMYFLVFHYGFDVIEKMATGSSGQIELGLSTIKNIEILLPSLEVQKEIVKKIEDRQKLIKPLIALVSNLNSQMRDKINML